MKLAKGKSTHICSVYILREEMRGRHDRAIE